MHYFKKVVFLLLFFLSLSVLWAGGQSSTSGGDSSSPVTLSFAHNHTEKGLFSIGAVRFKELVEQRSNGSIIIEIYPNGQLGADREIQEGIQIGTIDMGISSSPVASINDYVKILDAPYLFVNRKHIGDVLDGSLGTKMKAPLEDIGIIHLAYWENGFRQITNNKRAIDKPSDLSGIKLRTPESAVRLATFRSFGANPVAMSFKEVFGALQQGVIDGQENPLAVISQASLYEVQEYLSISNHVYSPAHLLMSKSVFDSLPSDAQDILLTAAVEVAKYTRDTGESKDMNLAEELEANGMTVNQVDTAAFVEAGKAVWPDVLSTVSFSDGEEIIEAISAAGEKYLN